MREFFQDEWQGIPFTSFAEMSADKVADSDFYEAFYREFFSRHGDTGWDSLLPAWRSTKDKVVELVARNMPSAGQVLSIGCGLGYVESQLVARGLGSKLEITETSKAPLRWLEKEFPADRIHVGYFPECLSATAKYDLIYLSAVDYCFDAAEWRHFLVAVRGRLTDGGRCLVISASLQDDSVVGEVRGWVADMLALVGLRKRGQLWGYLRTVAEYRDAMTSAGYPRYEDGRLADGTYWIAGQLA